jgi:hypothetical protein
VEATLSISRREEISIHMFWVSVQCRLGREERTFYGQGHRWEGGRRPQVLLSVSVVFYSVRSRVGYRKGRDCRFHVQVPYDYRQ